VDALDGASASLKYFTDWLVADAHAAVPVAEADESLSGAPPACEELESGISCLSPLPLAGSPTAPQSSKKTAVSCRSSLATAVPKQWLTVHGLASWIDETEVFSEPYLLQARAFVCVVGLADKIPHAADQLLAYWAALIAIAVATGQIAVVPDALDVCTATDTWALSSRPKLRTRLLFAVAYGRARATVAHCFVSAVCFQRMQPLATWSSLVVSDWWPHTGTQASASDSKHGCGSTHDVDTAHCVTLESRCVGGVKQPLTAASELRGAAEQACMLRAERLFEDGIAPRLEQVVWDMAVDSSMSADDMADYARQQAGAGGAISVQFCSADELDAVVCMRTVACRLTSAIQSDLAFAARVIAALEQCAHV
jgi:hypothetical protein